MNTDICSIEQNMASFVVGYARYDFDAFFVRSFHCIQTFNGMSGNILSVDKTVMLVAHQHEICYVSFQLSRKGWMAPRSFRTVGYDVGNVGSIEFTFSKRVQPERFITPSVLATACGFAPQPYSDFLWNIGYRHRLSKLLGTRSSPEMSLGSSEPRKAARERDVSSLCFCRAQNGLKNDAKAR